MFQYDISNGTKSKDLMLEIKLVMYQDYRSVATRKSWNDTGIKSNFLTDVRPNVRGLEQQTVTKIYIFLLWH